MTTLVVRHQYRHNSLEMNVTDVEANKTAHGRIPSRYNDSSKYVELKKFLSKSLEVDLNSTHIEWKEYKGV